MTQIARLRSLDESIPSGRHIGTRGSNRELLAQCKSLPLDTLGCDLGPTKWVPRQSRAEAEEFGS